MTETLTIRAQDVNDRAAVLSVLRDAFRRDDEARLVEALWREDAMIIELVAEQDGRIVGYCAFSEVTAEPALDGLLLGLAPLAVINVQQGQGHGKALAMAGLELCRQRGAKLVVVLGEPEYYSRFGFTPASDYIVSWATMDVGRVFQLIDFGGVTGAAPIRIHYHPAFSAV
ncbi:GNAT family N-acetyltransferase [Hyphococcus sp.]|uniref:GNAT family N-acetyltransferase n=1 Tax=Hyphococcus sp. TaxID=2038636 RepID=UPI00208BA839|nr:MAG: N-acetyltransferase [Marinicaulis sp.]